MEPQEYTISYFKIGDFKDANSNTWCEILFEEKSNEPMRIVVKDPSAYHVGQKVYGHVELKTSQAGKPYNRFYRDKRPDVPSQFLGSAPITGSGYKPKDEESIARAVALKAAVELMSAHITADKMGDSTITMIANAVPDVADRMLKWLKGEPAKLEPTYTRESPGSYQEDKLDAEFESMIQAGLRADGIDTEDYDG